MDNKRDYILRIFHSACGAGLCQTRAQFAELIGIDRSNLSSMLNGHPERISDKSVAKTRRFAVLNGLDDGPVPAVKGIPASNVVPQAPAQDGVFVPRETQRMFDNMAETIRLQAQMLSQAQFTIGLPSTAAQKKCPS